MSKPIESGFSAIAIAKLGLSPEVVAGLATAAARTAHPDLPASQNLASVVFPDNRLIDPELAKAVTLAAMLLEAREAKLRERLPN